MAITIKTTDIFSAIPEKASSKASSMSPKEYCDKVAKKAYELYVKRGCKAGHDKEDWYEAEKLVRAGKA